VRKHQESGRCHPGAERRQDLLRVVFVGQEVQYRHGERRGEVDQPCELAVGEDGLRPAGVGLDEGQAVVGVAQRAAVAGRDGVAAGIDDTGVGADLAG
jgi:hypothetical protein